MWLCLDAGYRRAQGTTRFVGETVVSRQRGD